MKWKKKKTKHIRYSDKRRGIQMNVDFIIIFPIYGSKHLNIEHWTSNIGL